MERFAPDAMDCITNRYKMLKQIMHQQPVGRRQLCKVLGLTERMVRAEIENLKSTGLIHATTAGICLSPAGEHIMNEVDIFVPFLFNIQSLAEQIKNRFNLREVILVPGDSQSDEMIKRDLGRVAAAYMKKSLFPGCTLAVTGGSTLAEVADVITDGIGFSNLMVVPARGGLGEEVEQQAGTIAARIAKIIGAQYRMLHIPDKLQEETAQALKQDPYIKEITDLIKSSDILFHGIGFAMEMANRRGLTAAEIALLQAKGAVGEAFRYYFDEQGNIVYEVPGIGLELHDLAHIQTVVAVAGGSNKAPAIKAVLNGGRQTVLITDEGAAQAIVGLQD
jgi:central glycolytic genes regulator